MCRLVLSVMLTGCASTHGTASTRTLEAAGDPLCSHRVPEKACTRHHPELAAGFHRLGDWCTEHGVPESQCLICHPELTFDALPVLPESADLRWLARSGEAVGELAPLAVKGKVTVFDFYADWCAPCRKVDLFMYGVLARRGDVALRKLNVVSWDTPLAKEQLANAASLPHLVVMGRDGKVIKTVTGLDLPALEAAIAEGGP
jgi:thiol-disulfide isomerase/thioredoxin